VENLVDEMINFRFLPLASKEATGLLMLCAKVNLGPDWEE
jgi:hypothetical protein